MSEIKRTYWAELIERTYWAELIEQPGVYRCWVCGRPSEGRRMLRVNGHAAHPGCLISGIRKGKL